MKMRLWNDLDNILILDTCAAANFVKKIKYYFINNNKIKKNSLIDHFHKKTIKLVNIENFRETFGNNNEEITTILKILKEFIEIQFISSRKCTSNKKCISNEQWKYLEKLYKEILKEYRKTNDHWIILKIMISSPKNKIFLLTEDSKFIKFLKKYQKFRNFEKNNKLKIFDVNNKNLKNKKNWYNKNINGLIR